MASASRKKRLSVRDREKERQIISTIGRRGFFKLIGLGTLGLGSCEKIEFWPSPR